MAIWWLVLAGLRTVNVNLPNALTDVNVTIDGAIIAEVDDDEIDESVSIPADVDEVKVGIESDDILVVIGNDIVVEVDGCPEGGPMSSIITHEGNTRDVIFRLKQEGTRDPYDVSVVDTVQLEVEEALQGQSFTPIVASPTNPGADFENGVVVVVLGAPISDVVGTYPYALTLIGPGDKVVTAIIGEIEVVERPGFPAP